jgi:hypothetical protein
MTKKNVNLVAFLVRGLIQRSKFEFFQRLQIEFIFRSRKRRVVNNRKNGLLFEKV